MNGLRIKFPFCCRLEFGFVYSSFSIILYVLSKALSVLNGPFYCIPVLASNYFEKYKLLKSEANNVFCFSRIALSFAKQAEGPVN